MPYHRLMVLACQLSDLESNLHFNSGGLNYQKECQTYRESRHGLGFRKVHPKPIWSKTTHLSRKFTNTIVLSLEVTNTELLKALWDFFALLLCQLLNDFIFQYSFGNLYFWKDFISCHGLLKLTQTTLTCVYTFQHKRSRIIQKRQIGDSFWRIDIFRDTYIRITSRI